MKILHYSLGFPPYRTGGLTKFCMDLMKQQEKDGHEVSLLWPGEMQILGNKTKIKKHRSVDGIDSYEVINPTPVSYDEGIAKFDAFMIPGDRETYRRLFDELQPSVIHIHTLMGLHKSFLEEANEKGIRLVFTTHDFFPICPKVTMFRHGQVCSCIESCGECGSCNCTALSLRKIQILQSPLYRSLKDNVLVRKLRKQHRDDYLSDNVTQEIQIGAPENYKRLREYYFSMLKMMDVVHYNSIVTKAAYEKEFQFPNSVVIPISHGDIKDRRKRREYNSEVLRIRYLGPQSAAKGWFLLRDALDLLWKRRKDFVLDVHFNPTVSAPYIRSHGRYNYEELEQVFAETDVLVCPSIWYETFGYTVLEALSFGVPVIVSDHVGAKDILANGTGIVIDHINPDKLCNVLSEISKEQLSKMNECICDNQYVMTLSELTESIQKKLYLC